MFGITIAAAEDAVGCQNEEEHTDAKSQSREETLSTDDKKPFWLKGGVYAAVEQRTEEEQRDLCGRFYPVVRAEHTIHQQHHSAAEGNHSDES